MSNIIKLKVDKINPEPSIRDMEEFGIRYNKKDWETLTNNSKFLFIFDKDLNIAQKIADILLKKDEHPI